MFKRGMRAATLLSLLTATVIAGPTRADDSTPPAQPTAEGSTIGVIFENDIFGGTDRDYTNGIRIDYLSGRNDLPLWGRFARDNLGWLTDAQDWYVSYGVGQNLYTPSDITLVTPPDNDRPYAGFLYGSIGIVADTGDQLDTIALDIGVVGPAALGQNTQTFVHSVIGADEPRGWDTQIRNEPGFRLLWERKYRVLYDFELEPFGLQVSAAPHFNMALGNVDTSGAVGMTFRIGDRLDDNYGPPRIRPAVSGPGFFRPSEGLGWYLFASGEARAVGHNIFLQGNTFRNGVDGVDPTRLVADFQGGFALQLGGVEMTYTHVLRSPEFTGQNGFNQFGSVNLRVRL